MRNAGWLVVSAALVGCAKSPPKPRIVQPVVRDVPQVLIGTIGSEVTLQGIEPTLVSGLGLVVGLRGTGGGEIPDRIAVTMERELGLMGVGKDNPEFRGTAFEGKTPRQVLRDKNVSVVIVQASIPPGAPRGAKFDVFVRALDNSPLTSLEGGILWSTPLRFGPPSTFGGAQTRQIAEAWGPIFINPFTDPTSGVLTRSAGRILDGGVVSQPLEILARMDNPSHPRAREIVSAINSRFPEGADDEGPIARGVATGGSGGGSEPGIAIRVPARDADHADEFINTLRYLQVNASSFPQEYARRYADAIVAQPVLAEELAWALIGVGEASIPFVRDLYEHGEIVPRLAALRAGAKLGDALAVPHLVDLASAGPSTAARLEAVRLLAPLDGRAGQVDGALSDLLDDPALSVRVAAYEALADRAERVQINRWLRILREQAKGQPMPSAAEIRARAHLWLPPGSMQGVTRSAIAGGDGTYVKFLIDVVPSGDPLIYITQQGEPRVVVFGEGLSVRTPISATLWEDRLGLESDSESGVIRVRFVPPGRARPIEADAPAGLAEFAAFLAWEPTPENPRPGLGLTYSEVVGVLAELQSGGLVDAAFATEQDRLSAEILRAFERSQARQRPEREGETPEELAPELNPKAPAEPAKIEPESWVVPLRPRPGSEPPK